MKKIVLLAVISLLPAVVFAQESKPAKYQPKKGDFSIGVTFNPVSLTNKTKMQPATGQFASEYLRDLGDDGLNKSLYIMSKDPLAAFHIKYRMSTNLSLRASVGLNGSKVDYAEYVRDDVAMMADPNSENKVIDKVSSSMNALSFGLGLEYSKNFGPISFIGGIGLQYALAGGSMKFQYGNAITSDDKTPSTIPLSAGMKAAGGLNENLQIPNVAWYRPVERKNVGLNSGIGLTCDMGIEWFFIGNLSLSAAMTFTPIMIVTQSQTYGVFEGWSTSANARVEYNNLVSPGSKAFLYGTENLGFRLALNYYL